MPASVKVDKTIVTMALIQGTIAGIAEKMEEGSITYNRFYFDSDGIKVNVSFNHKRFVLAFSYDRNQPIEIWSKTKSGELKKTKYQYNQILNLEFM